MSRWWTFAGWGLLALILLGSYPFFQFYEEGRKALSEDPTVWEENILALEENATGPAGSVLFVGSSSIRLWSSLHEDMAPIPVRYHAASIYGPSGGFVPAPMGCQTPTKMCPQNENTRH